MQVPKLKSTASVALNRKSKISIAIAMTAVALATRVSTCLQFAGRRSHSYGCSYSPNYNYNYNYNYVRGNYGRSSCAFIFGGNNYCLAGGKNECRNHEVISSSFSGWTAKSASTTSLYFSERGTINGSSTNDGKNNSSINIPALKKEVTRLSLRTHKKIGKASARLRGAQESLDRLRQEIMEQEHDNSRDDDNSEQSEEILMQKLENAPTTQQMEEYQNELSELQARLSKLNYLEEKLSSPPLHKKKILSMQDMEKLLEASAEAASESESSFQKIKSIIEELDISDDYENEKQMRVEMDLKNKQSKKQRAAGNGGANSGPRLPYRKYYSESNDLEIRVGKQATDNDVLSLSPEHRHPSHWWFHASGCPGSHVVLCTDAEYGTIVEDVMDAAALAAYKSKCYPGQSVIKVSMTHCRNVSKPPGAKAGLVQLNGEVRTVTLRKDEVERRWERLEKTVIIN
mmetsp:Transcript_8643/g.18461  ORF Transcript_8643/g.18461 Transcript_8643/m.18461 type:complete len:458 (+) Transcript_8643:129-1502(+)